MAPTYALGVGRSLCVSYLLLLVCSFYLFIYFSSAIFSQKFGNRYRHPGLDVATLKQLGRAVESKHVPRLSSQEMRRLPRASLPCIFP